MRLHGHKGEFAMTDKISTDTVDLDETTVQSFETTLHQLRIRLAEEMFKDCRHTRLEEANDND